MLWRTLSLSAILAVPAAAQDSKSAIPQNDAALQRAIAGLGKRVLRTAPRIVHMDPPAPAACSIALQAMPIGEGAFPIQRIPATEGGPMPNVAVPAPPCETPAR